MRKLPTIAMCKGVRLKPARDGESICLVGDAFLEGFAPMWHFGGCEQAAHRKRCWNRLWLSCSGKLLLLNLQQSDVQKCRDPQSRAHAGQPTEKKNIMKENREPKQLTKQACKGLPRKKEPQVLRYFAPCQGTDDSSRTQKDHGDSGSSTCS